MGETRRRLLDEVAKLMQKLDILHAEYEKSGIGGAKKKNTEDIPKRASAGPAEAPRPVGDPEAGRGN